MNIVWFLLILKSHWNHFSLLSQAIFIILPGRQPIQFYLCTDNVPVEFESHPLKLNWMMLILLTTSFILHICVWLKIAHFKAKHNLVVPLGQPAPVLPGNNTMMENHSISNFVTNVFSLLSLSGIFIIVYINQQLPSFFTQVYPVKNYVLKSTGQLWIIFFTVLMLLNHEIGQNISWTQSKWWQDSNSLNFLCESGNKDGVQWCSLKSIYLSR